MSIWIITLVFGWVHCTHSYACEDAAQVREALEHRAQAFFYAHKNNMKQVAQQQACSPKIIALLDGLQRVYDAPCTDQQRVNVIEQSAASILNEMHTLCATHGNNQLITLCAQMRFANRVRLHAVWYAYHLDKLLTHLDVIADWTKYWYEQSNKIYLAYLLTQPIRNWCLPHSKMHFINEKINMLNQMQHICRMQLGILVERMIAYTHAIKTLDAYVAEDTFCVASSQNMQAVVEAIEAADKYKRFVEPPSLIGRYWPLVGFSAIASAIGVRIGYLRQEKIAQMIHNACDNAQRHFKAGCIETGKAASKAWLDDHNKPIQEYEKRKKVFASEMVEYLNAVYGPMSETERKEVYERILQDDLTDFFGDSSKPKLCKESFFSRLKKFLSKSKKQITHAGEGMRLMREYGVLCKMRIDCGMGPGKDMMLAMGSAMPWWTAVGGTGAAGAAAYAYLARDTVTHTMAVMVKQYYDACVEYEPESEQYYQAYASRIHALHALKSLACYVGANNAALLGADLEKLCALGDMQSKREHAQFMVSWYPFLSCAVQK